MDSITLYYLGCSAFVLAGEGEKALGIDFWTKGAFEYAEDVPANPFDPWLPKVERLLVTHEHEDHQYVPEGCPVFYGKKDEKVVEDAAGVQIGGYGVKRIKSDHFPKGFPYQTENTVFVIEAGNVKIVHLGDAYGTMKSTDQLPELKSKLGDIDLLLLPIGSPFLKKIETPSILSTLDALKPKAIVPMHYWKVQDKKDILLDLENNGFTVLDIMGAIRLSEETFKGLNDKTIWNITPA